MQDSLVELCRVGQDCNLQCSEIYRGILGDALEHELLTNNQYSFS